MELDSKRNQYQNIYWLALRSLIEKAEHELELQWGLELAREPQFRELKSELQLKFKTA